MTELTDVVSDLRVIMEKYRSEYALMMTIFKPDTNMLECLVGGDPIDVLTMLSGSLHMVASSFRKRVADHPELEHPAEFLDSVGNQMDAFLGISDTKSYDASERKLN